MEHTTHPDAQWFGDAGLGMFIHWGISSVDATGELSWSMMAQSNEDAPATDAYFEQAEQFSPDQYDPDQWLTAAKRAGMEYAVLTTKHHDGFAMWPSEYGNFSTAEYCDGRDLVGEYVTACRRHGIKVGFYFSFPDWHHPSWPANARESREGLRQFTAETNLSTDAVEPTAFDEYHQYVQGQLRELLTQYGDIDLLWFDTPDFFWSGVNEDRIGDLYDLARTLQPHLVINGRGSYTHWGDYQTPENELPERPLDGWWELCQTWGNSWGYQRNDEYRDMTWTVERLAKTAERGGNLLLNVGPQANGTLTDEIYDRLDALGEWMDVCEPAVKGVRAAPWPPRCNAPITRGNGTWYVHVLHDYEEDIELADVPQPREIRLLRTGEHVKYDHTESTLSISIPDERSMPDEIIAISWDGKNTPAV